LIFFIKDNKKKLTIYDSQHEQNDHLNIEKNGQIRGCLHNEFSTIKHFLKTVSV